jgi:hypothetical protein
MTNHLLPFRGLWPGFGCRVCGSVAAGTKTNFTGKVASSSFRVLRSKALILRLEHPSALKIFSQFSKLILKGLYQNIQNKGFSIDDKVFICNDL